MSFSNDITAALGAKLNVRHVKTRECDGMTLSYVEGWHVIAEANRIFGFDAWDRETFEMVCVWENRNGRRPSCSYLARVRVRVRAGDTVAVREGTGTGHGTGATPGEAHESAAKEAETDAMKRALMTFGNPFGLALYDKSQRNVKGKPASTAPNTTWTEYNADRSVRSMHSLPTAFVSAVRRNLESTSPAEELEAYWTANAAEVERLGRDRPDLETDRGRHFSEVLAEVFARARDRLNVPSQLAPATPAALPADSQRIDKSLLAIAEPKRIRDKHHLRYVATQPCAICQRQPAEAHHLTFSQPRAMGRKVSDEWSVPLCRLHHRALHSHGDEARWWTSFGVDATQIARELWRASRGPQAAE